MQFVNLLAHHNNYLHLTTVVQEIFKRIANHAMQHGLLIINSERE